MAEQQKAMTESFEVADRLTAEVIANSVLARINQIVGSGLELSVEECAQLLDAIAHYLEATKKD